MEKMLHTSLRIGENKILYRITEYRVGINRVSQNSYKRTSYDITGYEKKKKKNCISQYYGKVKIVIKKKNDQGETLVKLLF